MNSNDQKTAVAPAIGVILVVAITVILATVIGAAVLDMGEAATDRSQQELGIRTTADGSTVSVTVITGSADELRLVVDGTVVRKESDVTVGTRLSAADVSATSTVQVRAVEAGDTHLISTANPVRGAGSETTTDTGTETTTSTPEPADTTLITYYEFESGSGETAVDSRETHDGDLINGPSWTTDAHSGASALSFDGNDDYVDTGFTPYGNSELTISVWVRPASHSSTSRNAVITGDNGGWDWGIAQDAGTWRLMNGQEFVGSEQTVVDGEWVHLVGVWNRNTDTAELWIDGTRYVNTDVSAVSSSNPMWIGASPNNGGKFYFDSTIDDVRIYNRALSSDEITTLSEDSP